MHLHLQPTTSQISPQFPTPSSRHYFVSLYRNDLDHTALEYRRLHVLPFLPFSSPVFIISALFRFGNRPTTRHLGHRAAHRCCHPPTQALIENKWHPVATVTEVTFGANPREAECRGAALSLWFLKRPSAAVIEELCCDWLWVKVCRKKTFSLSHHT